MFQSFLISGFVLIVFGWWGSNTAIGRHRFDEMAGIIPIAAMIVGTIVFAIGLWLFVRR